MSYLHYGVVICEYSNENSSLLAILYVYFDCIVFHVKWNSVIVATGFKYNYLVDYVEVPHPFLLMLSLKSPFYGSKLVINVNNLKTKEINSNSSVKTFVQGQGMIC